MCSIDLTIHEDGTIGAVHNDALADLYDEGQAEIKRASHVEPSFDGGQITWTADLSPVKGPKLGPYRLRSEALQAEIDWLQANGY